VEKLQGQIPGADVALSAEGADRDGVLVERGQVVTEAAVHVADPVELRGQEAGEDGDESAGGKRLQKVLLAVEVRHDHVLAVVHPGQRDVQLAVDALVGVLREVLLQALDQDFLNVKRRAERAQGPRSRLADHPQEVRRDLTCRQSRKVGKRSIRDSR